MLWPEVWDAQVSYRVPPATLFRVDNEEIDQFYYKRHLNANGAGYLPHISPALVKTYVKMTNSDKVIES